MTRKLGIAPVAAAVFLIAGSVPASAGVVTFNFNTLGSGANSTTIQTYMNNALLASGTTETVAVSGGALADKGYNGDGHVVGTTTTSKTLGTSEGSGAIATGTSCNTGGCTNTTFPNNLDTWIRNSPGIASFFFDFSKNFVIDSVSFDYEIFPDASCQVLSAAGCGGNPNASGYYPNQPDFTFSTDLGQVFHSYATTPTTANNDSPVPNTTELTPQLAPVNTGLLTLGAVAGSNVLNFADWPATIGIDNLVINYHIPPPGGSAAVPEPASLLLLGSGLVGIGARARKRRQIAKMR